MKNLHMHTFLVAEKIQKVGTDPSQGNSLFCTRWAPALHSEPFGQMRLWGVGDLLIT